MSREVALIGVLVFAFVALGGVAAQYEASVVESRPTATIENETFEPADGTLVYLDESTRDVVYNGTSDTQVYQNDTRINSSGNWSFLQVNGTLSINETNDFNTSSGATATITYNFTAPAGSQRTARDIALVPYLLGDGLGIIVGAALLLTAVVVLGRQQ